MSTTQMNTRLQEMNPSELVDHIQFAHNRLTKQIDEYENIRKHLMHIIHDAYLADPRHITIIDYESSFEEWDEIKQRLASCSLETLINRYAEIRSATSFRKGLGLGRGAYLNLKKEDRF